MQKKSCVFSIIIPLYNAAHSMKRTVSAVLASQRDDFELLLVNDGSTDETLAICNEYAGDSRVCVIDKKHGGLSDTRNVGFDHSRGEYIWFCDGDDIPVLDELERIRSIINHYDHPDIICANAEFHQEGKNYLGYNVSSLGANKFLLKEKIRKNLIYGTMISELSELAEDPYYSTLSAVWHKLFRREFLADNGLYFLKDYPAEDFLYSLQALSFANSVFLSDCILYHYYIYPNSLSHAPKYIRNCFELVESANSIVEKSVLPRIDIDKETARLVMLKKRWFSIKGFINNEKSPLSPMTGKEKKKYLRERIKVFPEMYYLLTETNDKILFRLIQRGFWGIILRRRRNW